MAQADSSELLTLALSEEGMPGIKALGDHLIELWGHEIRHRRMTEFIYDPLQENELPEEIIAEYKLVLVKAYFENNDTGFRFPKLLR